MSENKGKKDRDIAIYSSGTKYEIEVNILPQIEKLKKQVEALLADIQRPIEQSETDAIEWSKVNIAASKKLVNMYGRLNDLSSRMQTVYDVFGPWNKSRPDVGIFEAKVMDFLARELNKDEATQEAFEAYIRAFVEENL
jgi:hypothetical protein